MWKVASDDRKSLTRAYETALMNLLSSCESSISADSDSCGDPASMFVEDLEVLLIEGVFALEILRSAACRNSSNSNSCSNGLTGTGFHRLTEECYKFLNRSYKSDRLSDNTGPRKALKREEIGHLNNFFNAGTRKDGVVEINKNSIQSDVTTLQPLEVRTKDAGNEGKNSDDLLEASKCLAGLITLTESRSFESLLTSVCFKRNSMTSRDLGLLILESILATNGIQNEADLRNISLAFGETPLLLAVRARDADVVLALLRHGADVNRGWMGLENAIEVLLFSPNQILLEPKDIHAMERCLEYLLMVMPKIDMERLVAKEKEGYYPLHPDWRMAVTRAMEMSWRTDSIPVPSLQHLCRCTVRNSMCYLGYRLHEGLHQLPLPTLLRRFIQI